jgi:hypothetical protein
LGEHCLADTTHAFQCGECDARTPAIGDQDRPKTFWGVWPLHIISRQWQGRHVRVTELFSQRNIAL